MYRIRIPYSELIIKIAFFIFFFFTFFPTSPPFERGYIESERGTDSITEGNPLNQLIKFTVFILTLLASIYNIEKIISFVKKEKFLILLLAWSLITIFWSDVPIVTLKRWFQIFIIYFLIITFFTYYSVNDGVKIIKYIIYPYITITIISCLFISGAIDPQFGYWRGLTNHKNSLGSIGVILSVLTLILFNMEKEKIKKNTAATFFILSIIITLATLSSTSYVALFIFLSVTLLFWIKTQIFGRLGVQNSLLVYFVSGGILTLIIAMIFFPEFPDLIQGIFGKSETWYDRGKLWKVIFWEISQHPLLGCGFNAFWTIENPKMHVVHLTFIWLPKSAHNGYLDMINEIGLVGFTLFIIMIFKNIIRSIRYQILTPWVWFLVLPLITNITETNFLRIGPDTPIFIMLAYLSLEKIINKRLL